MALFGTAGIRGPVADVTPALAVAVGRAMATYVDDRGGPPTVVVARDGRSTGPGLSRAVTAGLVSGGATVRTLGSLPTPALAYASRRRFGVMLTASHNPASDAGIKLFENGVELDSAGEERIEALVETEQAPVPWDRWGTIESASVIEDYRTAVCATAQSHGATPTSLHVAVDCGNGMGAVATPWVLRRLGVTVAALNANVDGRFPARPSKPTAEAIADLRHFVAEGPVDIGIAHDGDADRIVIVDTDGDVVQEDTIVAILAAHYVRASDRPDPVVVTTPNASTRIDDRVVAAGGRIERVTLGSLHEGIAAIDGTGGSVVFAAEPWKHIHPELGRWIDGIASAAVLVRLIAEAGSLEALRAPVPERPYRKLSVRCPNDRKTGAMARLEQSLPDRFPAATMTHEFGIRLEQPDGTWLLIRPSGTEPYLRMYAEGDAVDDLMATARAAVDAAIEPG